jgi:uncharacterized protein
VDKLWHAAALGHLARVEEIPAGSPTPGPPEIDEAFWHACRGGQRRAAECLLRHGANINTIVEYAHGTALDVAAGPDTYRDLLVTWLREQGARTGPTTR